MSERPLAVTTTLGIGGCPPSLASRPDGSKQPPPAPLRGGRRAPWRAPPGAGPIAGPMAGPQRPQRQNKPGRVGSAQSASRTGGSSSLCPSETASAAFSLLRLAPACSSAGRRVTSLGPSAGMKAGVGGAMGSSRVSRRAQERRKHAGGSKYENYFFANLKKKTRFVDPQQGSAPAGPPMAALVALWLTSHWRRNHKNVRFANLQPTEGLRPACWAIADFHPYTAKVNPRRCGR